MVVVRAIWKQLKQRYLWMLDGAVLVTIASLVLYTASKHEPWADEAQAWLLARDFDWLRLVFSELRYEGHPALWFAVLSVAIHFFHMSYAYLGYLGGSFAIAGLGVLVFLAPFPRVLRCLIGFSFFFVYQYAVVARPYVLMPLLGFLAAHFYRKGLPRITTFAVIIALLIQVSSYAAAIALALSAFYGLQLALRWKNISTDDRKRVIGAATLVVFSATFLVVVLFPRSDSSLMADATGATFQHHLQLVVEGLAGALADSAFIAIPLVMLAGIWAYQRGGLLLLILSVGGTALEYGFLRGFTHHQGLITIAFVVFLWGAWPSGEQLEGLSRSSSWVHQALLAALVLTFGWHCSWSYSAIRKDWSGPYSGARDAAQFLKSVHADKLGCSGYLFWAVGVQPYFDHNIFLNYGGADSPASYHFSFDFRNRADVLMDWQALNGPPFIVVGNEYKSPEEAIPMIESYKSVNYALVHYSDGSRFFKNTKGTNASYFVFERIDFVLSTSAP